MREKETEKTMPRSDVNQETVVLLHQSKLVNFEDNPYKVVMDGALLELADSIRQYGVVEPIIVRVLSSDKYEVLSGQRRVAASRLAKLHKIPSIIKNLQDDDAIIFLVDSNLHREELLPSEKAFAYKLKLDAMKRQGKRTDLTSAQVGRKLSKESREILAEQVGESKNQISRYIRLTNLIDKLLDMVDEKFMPFNVGVELSFVGSKAQAFIADILEYDQMMISLEQASRIKTKAIDGKIDEKDILSIIYEKPKEKSNITLKEKNILQYFPSDYSKEQIEAIIMKLIRKWYNRHNK